MKLRDRELLAERRKAAEQEKLSVDPDFRLPSASEWTEDILLLLGVKSYYWMIEVPTWMTITTNAYLRNKSRYRGAGNSNDYLRTGEDVLAPSSSGLFPYLFMIRSSPSSRTQRTLATPNSLMCVILSRYFTFPTTSSNVSYSITRSSPYSLNRTAFPMFLECK